MTKNGWAAVVRRALARLTQKTLPAYEADDGPLTAQEANELRKLSAASLPKGRIVSRRSLF